jgi:hypothetical protein
VADPKGRNRVDNESFPEALRNTKLGLLRGLEPLTNLTPLRPLHFCRVFQHNRQILLPQIADPGNEKIGGEFYLRKNLKESFSLKESSGIFVFGV